MTTKAAKQATKPGADEATPKPKRSRNFKIRPSEPDGLITALRSDQLDQRTRQAREVLAVRDATAADPYAVTLALARDVLSVNAVIVQNLARYLTGPNAQILDEKGNVHELVAKHWPEAQSMLLKAAREVRRMEAEQGRQPAQANGPDDATDLTSLIMEAQDDADSR